jgi:uncharacterized protein YdeI (YjbR/CyaY-like superfamily)
MAAERKSRRASKDLPVAAFPTLAAWEAWLADHHESSPGTWLKFAKKDSGIDSVRYPEALDAALCYGWIDGQVKRLDDQYYLQRFTPRSPRSKWSKINCGKVAALTAAGRMKPAGLRQVEAATADGRWDAAYDSPRTATVPDDLRRALDADPKAAAFFASLDGRNRYAILYQVQDARRPETRARRVAKFAAMLGNREKLYP